MSPMMVAVFAGVAAPLADRDLATEPHQATSQLPVSPPFKGPSGPTGLWLTEAV